MRRSWSTFAGARVIVTGASSGIGRELARQLAGRGARLLITARRAERLEQLRDELPGTEVHLLAGDITDRMFRQRLVRLAETSMGGLDLLINNAGRGAIGRFDQSSPETLRDLMEVNFFAPVELTREALPLLRHGHYPVAAMIGSVLGHCGVPLKSEYCASKFALRGLANSLRIELLAEGVRVVHVSPSTTRSEFLDHVVGDKSAQRNVGSMSPAEAARGALRAIARGRADSVFPLSGKCLVWMARFCPRLLNWVLARK